MDRRRTALRSAATTLAALGLIASLAGCKSIDAPTAEVSERLVMCGSTNLYEAAPDAGFSTIREALDSRITWLRDVALKDPPTDGETEFDLRPELETMELASAAFDADPEGNVEREKLSQGEVVTIDAYDAEGREAGQVRIEQLPNGYFISEVVVRTGTAKTLEECP